MESKLLGTLGKIAGLGGIALGIFLLVFQGVLQKQFLPQAGLGSAEAFAVILSLMILTFGIAGIGLIAWLVSRGIGPEAPMPTQAMGTLAGLIVLVIATAAIAAVYVGAQSKSPDAQPPPTGAGPGGVVIGAGDETKAKKPDETTCTLEKAVRQEGCLK
jgi:hypothetical protein